MAPHPPASAAQTRRKTALAVGIGNFLEWFDFAVYGFFATTIGKLYFPNDDAAVSLLSSLAVFGVAFLMRPIGGFVIGSIGDRKGRRWALTMTVAMMGGATTLLGLMPTYEQVGILAPILLVLMRCLQGFSAGGEWTGSSAFLLEHVPAHRRGLAGSVISSTAALATVAGSLSALALNAGLSEEALNSWGWRVPFLAAAPLGLIGLYIRMKLDETPVFMEMREQKAVIDRPLRAAGRRNVKSIVLTFFFASVQGLGFYYLATYVVNHLSQTVGLPRTTALMLSAVGLTLYACLCPFAGALSDRFGRRSMNIIGSFGLALVAYPAFVLMSGGGSFQIVLAIFIFAIFQSMVSVTTVVMLTELFPAQTRGSGSAIGFNLGLALIGGPGPFIAAAIATAFTDKAMPAIYMVAVALAGALVVLRWLPETRGRALGLTEKEPAGIAERSEA
ncbi:MFS transporter [Nonomuraea sp. ZG12]|uniref:MFS transporter n=1 Tax=Nonomuraea sp. ZG12 TaxID=3452207 RepID=UPI003F8C317D